MENREKKIRVAIVATSLSIIGGQSIQAARLIDSFKGDERISLFFIPNNPETIFQKIKIFRTIFASLKFWWLLLKDIPKADVVQVFSSATTGYIIATLPPLFFSKVFRKKVILNYHSGELEDHIRQWKLTALPSMKRFDKIIVPSQFLVDIFNNYGLKAEAIYNFIDTERFKFRERKSLSPLFLSNRNFELHYNVSDILRAFQIIQEKYPGARLEIAGFGSEEDRLKELAATLGLKNYEFIGKIDPEVMPEVCNRADIYLNASLVDNMPLSFIEAYSCGLPIVSYKTGGIPYILEDGRSGILVGQNDYEALAKGAIRLLEDQEFAAELIKNAKAETSKYTWEKVKDQWRRLYSEI